MEILVASSENLEDLSTLFQSYREISVSYAGGSNLAESKIWISERLLAKDAIFFIAYIDSDAVGFATLYPSFSSISLKRIYIFNDLYVVDRYRNVGLGKQIIESVHAYAKERKSKGLELETARTNTKAQRLYESLGYEEIQLYKRYFWNAETG